MTEKNIKILKNWKALLTTIKINNFTASWWWHVGGLRQIRRIIFINYFCWNQPTRCYKLADKISHIILSIWKQYFIFKGNENSLPNTPGYISIGHIRTAIEALIQHEENAARLVNICVKVNLLRKKNIFLCF